MTKKALCVGVPDDLIPIFEKAQERVNRYFGTARVDAEAGTRFLGEDRHMIIRGDALAVELRTALETVCGDEDLTAEAANSLLFDIGHSIGAADARMFSKDVDLPTPLEKLAVGPIYFAHTGMGRVNFQPGSNPEPGPDFVLRFRHESAIEAACLSTAQIRNGRPQCILACGYSSGWCSYSFQTELLTVEVSCEAAGDDHCEFIMAPADRIQDYIDAFVSRHICYIPKVFGSLQVQQKIHALAYRDSLTGLPNRTAFLEQIEREIGVSKRLGTPFALVHIDLDHFKNINDNFGKEAGNFALKTIATRLRDLLETGDLIARFAGNEFIFLLPGDIATEDIVMRVRDLLRAVRKSISWNGITLRVSGTAGIVIFPHDADHTSNLLINAGLALHRAKATKRGTLHVFTADLRWQFDLRKTFESDLRGALDNGMIVPFFQPQWDFKNDCLSGMECLMRWRHPDRGSIAPSTFLPIAETAGEMVRLGRMVMEEAIKQAAAWRKDGIDFNRLSLNASGPELLESGFAQWLTSVAHEYDFPCDRLSVEILETVAMDEDETDLSQTLSALVKSGIDVELDDFGTGFASMTQIDPAKIQRIKIDRSFIDGIDTNSKNTAIVTAIIEMTARIGMGVIVEGVETQDELTKLLNIGGRYVQGYAVAGPMSAKDFENWVRNGHPLRCQSKG